MSIPVTGPICCGGTPTTFPFPTVYIYDFTYRLRSVYGPVRCSLGFPDSYLHLHIRSLPFDTYGAVTVVDYNSRYRSISMGYSVDLFPPFWNLPGWTTAICQPRTVNYRWNHHYRSATFIRLPADSEDYGQFAPWWKEDVPVPLT